MTRSPENLETRKVSGFYLEHATGSGKVWIPGNREVYALEAIRCLFRCLHDNNVTINQVERQPRYLLYGWQLSPEYALCTHNYFFSAFFLFKIFSTSGFSKEDEKTERVVDFVPSSFHTKNWVIIEIYPLIHSSQYQILIVL